MTSSLGLLSFVLDLFFQYRTRTDPLISQHDFCRSRYGQGGLDQDFINLLFCRAEM